MDEQKETLLTGYPNVITFDCTKEITNQMEKNICKIKIGEEQGTGFFCKIPFPDEDNMLKVLITNNHVINEDILYKSDEKISLFIKKEKKIKNFNLNNRIKYTNKKEEFDITIIEIKEDDEIYNYLELDDKIIKNIINDENENDDYIDKTFYIIQYPEGELSVSYGIIKDICRDKKYQFRHKCCTKKGSSGSPILNSNNKVIGIHTGGTKCYNLGTFLNYPLKDFIKQKYYKDNKSIIIDNKINEIFLKVINNKYNLHNENINTINSEIIKDYIGIEGYKDLKKLFSYYQNKIKKQILDIDFHKKIIEQMDKKICKIRTKDNCCCSGFFCKIPFHYKNNVLKVLITSCITVNEYILYEKDEEIIIYMKEGKKLFYP